MEVDLEEALNIAGCGRYQLIHGALMLVILTAALIEMIGCSYVIPVASCELNLPSSLRGIIACVPNIGIIVTAGLWGRVADRLGRRPTLLLSTSAAGLLGVLAALMPELITFSLCKLAASLFLSCPSSLCFAFISEVLPEKRRDKAILLLNALLLVSSVFLPLLAWAILPIQLDLKLGSLIFRSWRLLTVVYALPLLISSVLLLFSLESPKFLISQQKSEDALEILRTVFSINNGMKREEYPVSSIKCADDGNDKNDDGLQKQPALGLITLFKPPYLKWTSLTGFLMFGVFSSLNGLFIFVPDTINRVLVEESQDDMSICSLLQYSDSQTRNSTECVDTLSTSTFQISALGTVCYSILVLIASMSPVGKRTLLITTYAFAALGCLLSGLLKNPISAAIAMSSLQFTALGIGPITAYAVDLFPTSLRGSAVGTVLMFGRLGSVAGATVAGLMLASACLATFYTFAISLFVCCALTLMLPKDRDVSTTEDLNR